MNHHEKRCGPPEQATEGQSLGNYITQRPSLLLTFLDIAERYAEGDGRHDGHDNSDGLRSVN